MRSSLKTVCVCLFLLTQIFCPAPGAPQRCRAAEGGVVSTVDPAVSAMQERIERRDSLGQRSARGASAGAERIRKTVPLKSRSYPSPESCLTDQDLLRAASADYLRQQSAWCRDKFTDLPDQRGCRDVAVIYLETLGRSFCPRGQQTEPLTTPPAPLFLEPPAEAAPAPLASQPIREGAGLAGSPAPERAGQLFDSPKPGRPPTTKAKKSAPAKVTSGSAPDQTARPTTGASGTRAADSDPGKGLLTAPGVARATASSKDPGAEKSPARHLRHKLRPPSPARLSRYRPERTPGRANLPGRQYPCG